MKRNSKIAAAALLSLGFLTAGATAASAAIVCNAEGACWHVRHPYAYRQEYGVVVHPGNWRWGASEHYAWREHGGRGYWRNGVWVRF
jgi:hypothetical protein